MPGLQGAGCLPGDKPFKSLHLTQASFLTRCFGLHPRQGMRGHIRRRRCAAFPRLETARGNRVQTRHRQIHPEGDSAREIRKGRGSSAQPFATTGGHCAAMRLEDRTRASRRLSQAIRNANARLPRGPAAPLTTFSLARAVRQFDALSFGCLTLFVRPATE